MNRVKRFADIAIKDNNEIDKLYTVEQTEINRLQLGLTRLFNNYFINSCDLKTISELEKILKMKTNSEYTLEERRINVLHKLLFKPPFTRQRFQSILENIWGKGNYNFEILPDEFRVIVDISVNDPIVYLYFQKDVRKIIPANMHLVFSIQYTYIYLKRNYTYKKMSELTYGELSQYAKEV